MKKRVFTCVIALLIFVGGVLWKVSGRGTDEITTTFKSEACGRAVTPFAPIAQPNSFIVETQLNTKSVLSNELLSSWRRRAAQYEPFIHRAARTHGVDPRILWTLAFLETRFQPNLVSSKGACGMMQFMPRTAQRYGLTNPFNPADSIDAAARYVRDLSLRFGGRFELILAAYNAGEGTVEAYLKGRSLRLSDNRVINPRGLKLGGIPPYPETRNYVAQGLAITWHLSFENPSMTESFYSNDRRFDSRQRSLSLRQQLSKQNSIQPPLFVVNTQKDSLPLTPIASPPQQAPKQKVRSFRIAASSPGTS